MTYRLFLHIITEVFNTTAELVIPTGIPTKEAETEMETHPLIVEIKISEWSVYNSKLYKHFYAFYSLIHFDFISSI